MQKKVIFSFWLHSSGVLSHHQEPRIVLLQPGDICELVTSCCSNLKTFDLICQFGVPCVICGRCRFQNFSVSQKFLTRKSQTLTYVDLCGV